MPATFAHPVAVLPLKRFCPRWLNFAALVAGSMTPDFGYYFRRFDIADFSHTFVGSFLACVPIGCLLLTLLLLLRRPICYVLPQPHRDALMPSPTSFAWQPAALVRALISVLLGAWTHIIWDSFTHSSGWAVRHISFLHATAVRLGNSDLPVSYFLRQFSTLGGIAILFGTYVRWLRTRNTSNSARSSKSTDRWRYLLLASLGIVAVSIASPPAFQMASQFSGYLAFRVLVFRTAIYSIAAFIPLLILCSVAAFALRRNETPAGT